MMGVGMLAFSHIGIGWMVFPFLLLFAPGFGGSMTLRGAMLRDYFGRAAFGKSIGTLMGIASLGGVVGPVVAGAAFDTLGSYQPIWYAFCGLNGIGFILIMMMRPGASDTARGQEAVVG
jgi:hypothetical protein